MGARTGRVKRFIFGTVGLLGILAGIWWGIGNPHFTAWKSKNTTLVVRAHTGMTGEEPRAQACSECDQNVCPATAASWRELFRKRVGGTDAEKRKQGDAR